MGFAQVQSVVDQARVVVATLQDELTAIDRDIDRTLEVTSFIDTLLDAVRRFVDDILRGLRAAADALSKVPRRTVVTTVVNMCARAIEIIARRLERVAQRMSRRRRRRRNELAERFERAVSGIQDKIVDLSGLLANAERILNVLWDVAEALKPQEPWVLKLDKDFFTKLDAGYLGPARGALKAINDQLAAVSAQRQAFTSAIDRIEVIRDLLRDLESGIGNVTRQLSDATADVQGFAQGIEAKVRPIIEDAGKTISDIPVIGTLFDGAVAVVDKISEWCDDIVDGLEFIFGRDISEALGRHVAELEGFFNQIDQVAAEVEALMQQIDRLVEDLESRAESAGAIMEVVLRILEELTLGKVDIERRLPHAVRDFLAWARRRREEAGKAAEDELPEFLRELLRELRARRSSFVPGRIETPIGVIGGDVYAASRELATRIDTWMSERVERRDPAGLRPVIIELLQSLADEATQLGRQLEKYAPEPPVPNEDDFAFLTALATRAATIGELCGSTGLFLVDSAKRPP